MCDIERKIIKKDKIKNNKEKQKKYSNKLRVTKSVLVNFLEYNGYILTRNSKGHTIYRNYNNNISIPLKSMRGNETVPQGTQSKILQEMKLTRNDLGLFVMNN